VGGRPPVYLSGSSRAQRRTFATHPPQDMLRAGEAFDADSARDVAIREFRPW